MSNGTSMIIHLIVGLIKKTFCKKWVNTFLSHLEVVEEISTLKLICLIMQQNRQ